MAVRRPIVRVGGQLTELPLADTLPGAGGGSALPERLRAVLANAALAFNNNPRARGVIASGAPTITVGTATPPAAHTRLFTFGNPQAPFVSSGGRPTTVSGRTTFPVVTPSATRLDFAWRVETIVDSDSVGFLLDSAPTNGYRFLVDGQYVSAAMTTSAAGGERYYRLQWPTKRRRRVIVEGTQGLGFWGAAVPDDGGCFLPHDPNALRLFIVGDSDLFLEGFQPKGDSYGFCLGDFLGVRDTWCAGVSSTGFVVISGGNNYAQRRADWSTLPADSIDVLAFQISVNEAYQNIPAAQVKAAIALELAQARAAHPNAIITVHGCIGHPDPANQSQLVAFETAAGEAIAEANDPLMRLIPVYQNGVESYRPLYGVPAAGDTGTGNSSRYVSFAVFHMNAAGNVHYAEWLARRYIEAFADMAGVPVPALAPPQAAVPVGGSDRTAHTGAFEELPIQSAAVATPAAGFGRIYMRQRAGRVTAETVGPSGVDNALQPAWFNNRIMVIAPSSGTGVSAIGINATTAATLSHPALATTSLAQSLYRTRCQTSTTAGNPAGIRHGVATMLRGNATALGGFYFHARVCSGNIALAGGEAFIGLSSTLAALSGAPSALADAIGLVKDVADTAWQFTRRTGTGTVQKVPLTTPLTYAANQAIDVILYCAPSGTGIGAVVRSFSNAGVPTTHLDTTYTTDIPAAATLLGGRFDIRNGATAAAADFELVRMYAESDF